jgi:mono/diheme cytochrome c family protein
MKKRQLKTEKKIRMKKILIISGVFISGLILTGCRGGKNDPGKSYMPDMAYSRAYETYASTDNLKEKGIYYDATPVAGTVARGDLPAYPFKNDSLGYINSANAINPLPALDAIDYMEAARLYLVNCGICHGEKLDGNGPLYNNGDGPFAAKPANLISDAKYTSMPEGTMFHSVTYGIRAMGSYASQLSSKQRWMIIHYIKEKQSLTAKPAVDTVAKK